MVLLRANFGRLLIAVAAFLASRDCCAAPSFSAGVSTGNIQNSGVVEASGIAASRFNTNVLWTHNDRGNAAQVFPMTLGGGNLGTYTISGASNIDWEDIAVGPGPTAGAQYLYIGDIGDNDAGRGNIKVYRVPEPTVSYLQSPSNVSVSGAATLTFAYPVADGPRDAESMFVDPLTKDIYIITKRENPHRVYRAVYPQSTSGTTTLQYVTQFNDTHWLTGADISVDGYEIIVRGDGTGTVDDTGRMFIRPVAGSIADAFNSTPIMIPLVSDGQGEAIGFDRNGWGYYTTSEGSSRPIHYFNRVLDGDLNHNNVVDAADYVLWRNNNGTSNEYGTWRSNFGKSPPPSGSLTAVPEPEGWLMLVIGVALMWHCDIRRTRTATT